MRYSFSAQWLSSTAPTSLPPSRSGCAPPAASTSSSTVAAGSARAELLLHFGERCRQLYFEATSGSRQDQLDDLSAELAAFTGRSLYAEQPLTTWRAAFAAFAELLATGQTMIVLDEFQFIARAEPEVGSLLNRFVREHVDNPDLLLCLSGSDISFFERDVVGYGATTYGRRTGSLSSGPSPGRRSAPSPRAGASRTESAPGPSSAASPTT